MGNQIIQSIKTIAQSLVDKAGYDKTRGGFIVGVNSVTNTYSVKVDGVTYPIVRAVDDATYNIGDVVKVVIPCNQATQMYISSSVLSDDSTGNKIANAVGLAQEAKQLGLENQADISNAAKVATNYIHSDSTNGLVVNNNQNVGVGYDIQLKADGSNTGMNIRQNGNILASFLQNHVSLGKNSINSKIGMCGDKGGVSASFGYYVDSVASNNGEPGSTLSFDFNETTFKNKVGQKTGFYNFIYTSADGWELFDYAQDTTSKVTLSQYGITMKTPTSSIKDNAGITINYVIDGSVKFYNADISNPVRKLELEMAENPSSSESDYANITIERQSGTYANGDGKEHSIITMMTLHEFANVSTLQLFDDEISLDATHLHLTSTYGEGSIQLNGDVYVNGELLTGIETRTLLWTNARPTSDFAAQTVSLSLSGYNFVEVVYKISTSSTQQIIERCEIGAGIRAERFYNPTSTSGILKNLYRGGAGASTNGYAFGDAYVKTANATGSTKNNSYMIPYKIYGIKGV